jgi:putative ABC transport system permease protein
MALGIGMTATMYGVIDAAMLRGLPLANADRVVTLFRAIPAKGANRLGIPARDFIALRDRQRAIEDVAAYAERPMNVSGDDRPERIDGTRITAGAFALLPARPALGRDFLAEDDVPGRRRSWGAMTESSCG